MKITIVIVTYNRLDLLKECFAALQNQTYQWDKIIIVNNNSTDATAEYLNSICDERVSVHHLPENIGGAGGFSFGIREAIMQGADWVWIMDDDTIPSATALEELAKQACETPDAGYLSSKSTWMDGTMHIMNRQWTADKTIIDGTTPDDTAVPIKSASFVSLYINADAVKEVGLPIKEFFIWCDDTEYTTRIFNAGYKCLYVGKSVVMHKTATNYLSSIADAPESAAWKFYYNMRNMIYLKRKRYSNTIVFLLKAFNYYRLEKRHLKKRTEGKAAFYKQIKRGFKDGLRFNPQIEYV